MSLPLDEAGVAALRQQVLGSALVLSVLLGVLLQRTRFCSVGALADWLYTGSRARLRMWVLAMGVALLGFNALVASGQIAPDHAFQAEPRWPWLGQAIGGAMFGVGMVLASGCGARQLVRAGGGSLKACVVLLTLACSAYAALRGVFAVLREHSVERVALTLPGGQDLPRLLASVSPLEARTWALVLGVLLGGALIGWALSEREGRQARVGLGGVGVGAIVVAVWWVAAHLGSIPEHPHTLEPALVGSTGSHANALSFVAPVAQALEWLLMYSDALTVLNISSLSVFGVLAGSAVSSMWSREFRWEGFAPGAGDVGRHLTGAVLMGVGGVAAGGCTFGQGLSGLATLSVGSALALGTIVAGAVATLRWQEARV